MKQKPFYTYLIDPQQVQAAIYPDKMYQSLLERACRKASIVLQEANQYVPDDVKLGWFYETKEKEINFYYTVSK